MFWFKFRIISKVFLQTVETRSIQANIDLYEKFRKIFWAFTK